MTGIIFMTTIMQKLFYILVVIVPNTFAGTGSSATTTTIY